MKGYKFMSKKPKQADKKPVSLADRWASDADQETVKVKNTGRILTPDEADRKYAMLQYSDETNEEKYQFKNSADKDKELSEILLFNVGMIMDSPQREHLIVKEIKQARKELSQLESDRYELEFTIDALKNSSHPLEKHRETLTEIVNSITALEGAIKYVSNKFLTQQYDETSIEEQPVYPKHLFKDNRFIIDTKKNRELIAMLVQYIIFEHYPGNKNVVSLIQQIIIDKFGFFLSETSFENDRTDYITHKGIEYNKTENKSKFMEYIESSNQDIDSLVKILLSEPSQIPPKR